MNNSNIFWQVFLGVFFAGIALMVIYLFGKWIVDVGYWKRFLDSGYWKLFIILPIFLWFGSKLFQVSYGIFLEFKKKVELGKNYNPEGEFGFSGFWTSIGYFLIMIGSSFFLGTMIWLLGVDLINIIIGLF